MRKILVALALFASVGFILIGCASGSSSHSSTDAQTCWATGQGLVIKTVETNPNLTGANQLPCSAPYALGQPQTTGPVTGLGTPTCNYSFASGISWWVWDTDNGTSGNAEQLCDTLSGE
jgi:hypothetical protein